MKKHFDVIGFTSSEATNDNPSVVGRMANLLKTAVTTTFGRKVCPLPKIIVIVPDEDIIDCLKDKEMGLPNAYSRLVKFLMNEYERNLASFKENLPLKSKREGYPHLLWILAPLHDKFYNNSQREKFNRCVEDMAKFHVNVICLELKKVWNSTDSALVDRGKITSEGLKNYWEAVDKTVRYCDSVMLKKRFAKKTIKMPNQNQNDKFRWHNPKIRGDVTRFKEFKKLPTPPPRH